MALIRLEASDEFLPDHTSVLQAAQALMEKARNMNLIVTKCEIVEEVGHL